MSILFSSDPFLSRIILLSEASEAASFFSSFFSSEDSSSDSSSSLSTTFLPRLAAGFLAPFFADFFAFFAGEGSSSSSDSSSDSSDSSSSLSTTAFWPRFAVGFFAPFDVFRAFAGGCLRGDIKKKETIKPLLSHLAKNALKKIHHLKMNNTQCPLRNRLRWGPPVIRF